MRDEEVSTLHLYLMRTMYVMMFLFLASSKWPVLFSHAPWTMMYGVAIALLAALGFLSGWAIRYPVKFLPILLFEWIWKTIWVVALGYPAWRAGAMDAGMAETWKATVPGVILVPLVIPWPYVWRNYIKARGDRWGRKPKQRAETVR
jgi:hypothetical protein